MFFGSNKSLLRKLYSHMCISDIHENCLKTLKLEHRMLDLLLKNMKNFIFSAMLSN